MDKLDRLGWADGISFVAYGVRSGIRVTDPSVLELVREHLPPGWKPASSPAVDRLYSLIVGGGGKDRKVRRLSLLYGNLEGLARSRNLAAVLEAFAADLRLYVAENARHKVFVHAGVVGWQGRAILIPGRSFSGKSMLVADLVCAGATYYSDEYAVLDTRGRVHPFPTPLSIREDGRQKNHPVEAIGVGAEKKPLPVGLVVASRYRPGARWRPRALSPGRGALTLLHNAVPARRRPADVLAILERVVSRAQVLEGLRGETAEVVDSILFSGRWRTSQQLRG